MSTLWLTSFNKEMYQVSGMKLLDSFHKTHTEGKLFIGTEEMTMVQGSGNIITFSLEQSEFLQEWLKINSDIIPESLGGTMKPCNCKEPWAGSENKHKKKNCPHTWFNRNASRWFRKIATLYEAIQLYRNDYNHFIWIDCDCRFIKKVTEERLSNLFKDGTKRETDVLILKSVRRVLEAGFVGYNISCCRRTGYDLLMDLFKIYTSGEFRKLYRYDDCYTLQKCIKRKAYRVRDLARNVNLQNHNEVFAGSLIGDHIEHDKGKHSRKLNIMK